MSVVLGATVLGVDAHRRESPRRGDVDTGCSPDGAIARMSQTTVYDTWLIGYASVSKADGSQSLDLQRDALRPTASTPATSTTPTDA